LSDKIRVGFDARWYNDSGVGAYVAGLVPAIARLEDRVELLVYESPSNRVPALDGLPLQRIELAAPKYSVAEQLELARRCHDDGLDLLHCPFYVVPLFATCRVIATVHDLIPFLYPIYGWPRGTIVRQAYRMAARKAKHIIADSGVTAAGVEKILHVGKDRTSVVHLAAGACYQSEAHPGEELMIREKYGIHRPYIVLASARNWRTKNLQTALLALESVRANSGIDFQTVVYGPDDGMSAAGGEERWRSLNITCTGYIQVTDLAGLFRHATAFLMPSLHEGFGLPVVEAMACGCAVVASNGGALAEVTGKGAQTFDPFDVTRMAGAVTDLLRDRNNLARWRAAALRRSHDFSWQKAARETISVYHRTHQSALSGRIACK
jgi:glycosyltransferase involved in cell wall biosynthesis